MVQVYLCKIGEFKRVDVDGISKLQLKNFEGKRILCIKRENMFFDISNLRGYEVISDLDINENAVYVYEYKCAKVDENLMMLADMANDRLDFYERIGDDLYTPMVFKENCEFMECQLAMFMGYDNGVVRAISSGNFIKALFYNGSFYDLKTGEEVHTFNYEDKVYGESYIYEACQCDIMAEDLISFLGVIKKQGNHDELPKVIKLNFGKSQNN